MSTEPNAPPSDDDATRQEDVTTDDFWKDYEFGAYSERILIAAWRHSVNAYPPAPLPSPIHPDVTTDDMGNAINVLFAVITALRDGTRHDLDNLRAALDTFAVNSGEVPKGKEEQYVFFMRYVGMDAANYHLLRADGKSWPFRFQLFRTSPYLHRCDPAFVNVDEGYLEKCYEEIVWGGNNRTVNHWKRAAAKIAVSVGAFGSRSMGKTDEERADELLKLISPKWSTIGKTRFQDPEQHIRDIKALKERLRRR